MAKFLIKATYTAEGAKGLMRDGGSGRRAAITKALDSMGGKLEGLYFAYGDVDVYVLIDVPDAASAIAMSLTVNASGAVHASMTPLITPEELDAATKKTVSYRAPGA